ncbi:dTMP kinase [Gordonia sp. (in: high G+C Gram-positive bacteria)]|uniref:dTMP kinase n=1 Tax=Gordonia sp. (in: high G+C Gram-positive bacteria) TaxID=84139 RepID=UPI00262EFB3B|nr:dTMP kinase [Gordonia sp. (in: high G+C Gram-positive bacteria)]
MGILVAIEGLDGAGKNTIARRIVAEATDRGLSVTSTTFPSYGTHLTADLAAEALHGEHGDLAQSAYAMALLFALDRREARSELAAALDTSDLLLCDRYVASNAAYSAARLGEGPDGDVVTWVRDLEFGRFALPRPAHQLLLGVPPEVAMERAEGRAAADAARARDAYERDADLQTRVYRSYLALADASWMSDWTVADGDDAVAAVLALLPPS